MKKITKILSLLLALVFAMSAFVACGSEPIVEQVVETVYEGGKNYVQVQWVWGQVILKEEYVEKGSKLTEWTPVVEGRDFLGWYEIPEEIKLFEFETTKVRKSMKIYAAFSGGPVDITTQMPDWYLIGTGKGDLGKSNNWNHEASAQHLGLRAGEDGIYKITLDLYAGDQFKMTQNLGWDNEKAIDKMAGFADGKVTDANGTIVFTAGENNNIAVAEGQNGKYEITYDPNADQFGFKKLEELGEKPDDIRLIGTFKGNFSTNYVGDEYKFSTSDKVIWTYEWEVDAEYKFKVYNNISGVYYPGGMGNDLVIKPGKYTVTFNLKTQAIVVTDENGNPVDVGSTGGNTGGGTSDGANVIRFAGNFSDWANTTSDWNLTKGDDGVWRGTLTITEDMYADWSVSEGASELSAAVKLYNPGTQKWYAHTGEANLFLTAGTYHFKCVESNPNFVYWRDGEAEPATPAGGTTGGNTGSSDVPTGSLPEGEGTLVFFVNDWLWSDIKCYWWDAEKNDNVWPGATMVKVGTTVTGNGTRDVYAIRVPVGMTSIIFNGKDNGNDTQSPDITEGITDGAAWMMLWDGETKVVPVEYTYSAQ